MRTVLLVSEEKLKSFSAIHENLQTDDLTPHINDAQNIHLQNQIGSTLLTHLKQQVIDGTLTADEKLLLEDYIAPMLIQWSFYLALPFIKYKIVDKGIVSGTSETSTATTLDELQYLRASVSDTAEYYSERLRKYLIHNTSLYPQYTQSDIDGVTPDRENQYFSGLVIPHRKYKTPYYCEDDIEYIYPIY